MAARNETCGEGDIVRNQVMTDHKSDTNKTKWGEEEGERIWTVVKIV